MSAPSPILLLTAMPVELAPLVRRLRLRPDGRGYRSDVVLARVLGIGAMRASERLESLLREHRPDSVVLAGFAGALSPAFSVGDTATIGRILSHNGEAIALPTGGTTLFTADEAVTSVLGKRQLRERSGADLVDMESWPVAHRLQAMGVPLVVIRAVTDAANDALPADVLDLTGLDGRARPGRVARCVLRRPWRIVTLARLGRAAGVAGAAMAEAVAAHVATLRP